MTLIIIIIEWTFWPYNTVEYLNPTFSARARFYNTFTVVLTKEMLYIHVHDWIFMSQIKQSNTGTHFMLNKPVMFYTTEFLFRSDTELNSGWYWRYRYCTNTQNVWKIKKKNFQIIISSRIQDMRVIKNKIYCINVLTWNMNVLNMSHFNKSTQHPHLPSFASFCKICRSVKPES